MRRLMYGDGDDEQPWRDTMQVCLEGDVITDRLVASPDLGKAFCPKDGAATISQCQNCANPIPGQRHVPNVSVWGGLPSAPERCEHCGASFPWTGHAAAAKSSVIAVDEVLSRLFEKFDDVARQLRQRHEGRATLDVGDEYDVQDLLHSLLRLYWNDVREEQWTGSYAGKSARIDFTLPTEQTVVEVKMARKGLTHKELGDQLIVDIARYSKTTPCKHLYCFVYDPHGYIKNPHGVATDLEKMNTKDLTVKVFIRG